MALQVCAGTRAGEWDAWVFSAYDSGLRGRPRVTFDVTAKMHQIGVQCQAAKVNMVSDIQEARLPAQSAVQLARALSMAVRATFACCVYW